MSEDTHDRLLQMLSAQNEAILQLLEKQNVITEKQNETIEKMREEQNSRMQEQYARLQEQNTRLEAEQNTRLEAQNTRIEAQNTRLEGITMALSTLLQNSNSNSEVVVSLMKELISAVKTLEKNSNLDHDEEPSPEHELQIHEPGWHAVFETLTSRMKDQVERWRNGMDSTLIFVALFLTVITSFQAPVSQNLSPNPVDLTNSILGNLTTMVYEIALLNGLKVPGGLPQPEPFRPALTDQIVTFFWYTAVLLSLITAICSVIGRQWVEHLMKKPEGQSYKDRSWRLDIREKLAEKLLRPVLDSLHPILVVSIVLFIVGLLFQLWSTSFSTGKPPILMLTSSLGSALILGTAAVTVYTFAHGVLREESPFTTSTSLGIRRCLAPRHIKAISKVDDETDLYPLFCSTAKQMGETHHLDQVSTVSFLWLLNTRDIDKIELAVDTIVSVLGSDASLKAKQTIAWNLCTSYYMIVDLDEPEKTVECYRRLHDVLESIYSDTPSSQKKVRLTILIAQMVIRLKFSGRETYPQNLENEELREIFLEIFMLDPKNCIDRKTLGEAKKRAYQKCLDLEREDPRLFDDVNDYVYLNSLSWAIVFEDDFDPWKSFILKHLTKVNVTDILRFISTASGEENANYFHLVKILFFVLFNCNFPIVFPIDFKISNFIKFGTIDRRRFDDNSTTWQYSHSIVDVLLSCLSLMDSRGALLSLLPIDAQQDLLEFLISLNGHESEIRSIRNEIALLFENVKTFRDRVARSITNLSSSNGPRELSNAASSGASNYAT